MPCNTVTGSEVSSPPKSFHTAVVQYYSVVGHSPWSKASSYATAHYILLLLSCSYILQNFVAIVTATNNLDRSI